MSVSPLPWTTHQTMRPWAWNICDADNTPIATDLSREDAEYIVEHVNHQVIHIARRDPDFPVPRIVVDEVIPPNTFIMVSAGTGSSAELYDDGKRKIRP